MSTSIPKISQLTNSVWRVLGCNPSPMTLQGTNMYLIGQGSNRILVDAGPAGHPEYIKNMKKVLTDQKVTVDHLILTHWHLDHTTALPELIPVFQETSGGKLPRLYKFPRLDKEDIVLPKEYPFQSLKAGETITTEGVTLKVSYAPGHTTDHALLQYVEENSLFCGDCLLGEGTGIFDDLTDYMNSLNLMLSMRSHSIYCGHGPVITKPTDSINYNMNHVLQREKKICAALEQFAPKFVTPMEIAGSMYKGLSTVMQKQAASSIQLHLTKLARENRVQFNRGRYGSMSFAVGG